MGTTLKDLWFRDPKEDTLWINETAVRIRAGILLVIPVYMAFFLIDVVFGPSWEVTGGNITDTFETDWDGRIIYSVEAVRRTFDYTFQSWLLIYALFEMLAGMTVATSRLSPTILIASLLARRHPAVWKPLVPKRFAWTIGALMITTCLIFFNPEIVSGSLNAWLGTDLPTELQYMPLWIPMLVWVCLLFMWMEAILGFCVGCQIHALLVKMNVIEEPCEACGNIDWDAIRAAKAQRDAEAEKESKS